MGCDILKVAVMHHDTRDVITLLSATQRMYADYAHKPLVTMSMGRLGVVSRLCGQGFGSAITFGLVDKASAPGQIPAEKLLRRVPAAIGLAVSFGLFLLLKNISSGSLGFEGLVICPLPQALYRNLLTAYLGFPPRGFFSTDYFPLFPWFFLFVTGYFLFRVLEKRDLNQKLFAGGQVPLLNLLGRHSLLVYLLHQPILYGLSMLLF
jgi:hypothetical protein